MDLYSDIINAQDNGAGKWLFAPEDTWGPANAYDYLLEITLVENYIKERVPVLKVHFKVLKSTCPQIEVGEERSWTCKRADRTGGPADARAFFNAAVFSATSEEFPKDDKDAAVTMKACCEEGLLEGVHVKCSVWNRKTKAGNPFSKHTFFPPND